MKNQLLIFSFFAAFFAHTQSDSILIRTFYNEALSFGKSYENLRFLCKQIGARISGSTQAQMAVEWGKRKMEEYGFENIQLQPVMVTHWERGTKEVAWLQTEKTEVISLDLLALGGSIGTNGMLRAEVIGFNSLEELKKATKKQVEGKIVFINQPMSPTEINTFKAYTGCYEIRGHGAVESAKLGAVGVVIRSLALPNDDHPHTGSMYYEDGTKKIPAAALSTNSCEKLASALNQGKVYLILEMNCQDFPDTPSFNVIGELKGSSKSDSYITIGGHLDSWDTGEGAHDDGAGIIHCLEAFRLLKKLGIKPIHTLRIVLFMNEENGNKGGEGYAAWVVKKNEKHVAAIESDRGGFTPQGFDVDGSETALKLIQSFHSILKPYQLFHFEKGYGGVDINPLKQKYPNITLIGFVPDSQRYFDVHHSPNDTFEQVNKRELELGCAAMASFIYLLDKNL